MENSHFSLQMNSEQFLHGSEQHSTLHKTDLLVYDEVIQQYDNELRFVIFITWQNSGTLQTQMF